VFLVVLHKNSGFYPEAIVAQEHCSGREMRKAEPFTYGPCVLRSWHPEVANSVGHIAVEMKDCGTGE
jgi:hypothetical protein